MWGRGQAGPLPSTHSRPRKSMFLRFCANPDGPSATDPDHSYGPFVWTSEDAGRSWLETQVAKYTEGGNIVVTAPSTAGIAYLSGIAACVERPQTYCSGSIFKTTDGGSHWQVLPVPGGPGEVFAVAVDPTRPEVVYVGGVVYVLSGGVSKDSGFRSRDGGSSWTAFGSDLLPDISHILIDSRTPETIFIPFAKGVLKSSDGGDTWHPTGLAAAPVNAMAQDPRTGYLYAGTDDGLFESRDAGTSWALHASTGGVNSLAADPRSGALYAAIVHGGIQVTLDGGLTWSPVGYGFSNTASVHNLAISSDGSILYTATSDGVYRIEFHSPHRVAPR